VSLSPRARQVQEALAARGFANEVVELPDTTRSAAEAAAALGCRVEQIVKSLVFRGVETGSPLLVVAGGANCVDEAKVAALVGEAVERPDADFVRARTGFSIGGVPPLGHAEALQVLIDEDLLREGEVWAAAGTPFAVFGLDPADLEALTGGRVARVAQ
jgi:prolyl-tRNA editing enzyme YbaK/EbsC (Cys-tRNA(Pro) deacylase)